MSRQAVLPSPAAQRRWWLDRARESLSDSRFRRLHAYAGLHGFHHFLLNSAISSTKFAAVIDVSPDQRGFQFDDTDEEDSDHAQ